MTKRKTRIRARIHGSGGDKPESRQFKPGLKRRGGNPNPPPPPKEYQFKPGQSGNPGGRPKLLGDAYRAQLAKPVPGDPEGRTYAEAIAQAMAIESFKGNVPAAREVRSATEGERIRTWRDEVIDLLRKGEITPDDVIAEFGADEAQPLLVAAGIRRDEGGEAQGESGKSAGSK